MEPTDALFDAINRGDLAAARDAVNRGADLSGHNVLGMTPIQLSVDLGRNDITFLLLANGAGPTSGPPPAATTASRSRHSPGSKTLKQATRNAAHTVRTVSTPPPQQMPRLFAGNGGDPIPAAGFLGFDPGH
jgi:hypothetical protein